MADCSLGWTERMTFQPDPEFKKELANETDAVWEKLMASKSASYYRIPSTDFTQCGSGKRLRGDKLERRSCDIRWFTRESHADESRFCVSSDALFGTFPFLSSLSPSPGPYNLLLLQQQHHLITSHRISSAAPSPSPSLTRISFTT